LKSLEYVEKQVGYISVQDWTADMPKVLADVGGFVDADIHVPEMDPALLNLETQLLLWTSHEVLNTFPQAIGTEEARQGAIEALEDVENNVREGKMLHWRFMIGIGKKPE
jgi:hypothetical protein